jgi:hypothetical protein
VLLILKLRRSPAVQPLQSQTPSVNELKTDLAHVSVQLNELKTQIQTHQQNQPHRHIEAQPRPFAHQYAPTPLNRVEEAPPPAPSATTKKKSAKKKNVKKKAPKSTSKKKVQKAKVIPICAAIPARMPEPTPVPAPISVHAPVPAPVPAPDPVLTDDVVEMNLNEWHRMYSSVHKKDPVGGYHARSMLDSDNAWCASANNDQQWMIIDAGCMTWIKGVVVQSRPGFNQFVTAIKVAVSDDFDTWTDVDGGVDFTTGCKPNSKDRQSLRFATAVKSRYVKLIPAKWSGHISMRAALLLDAEVPIYLNLPEGNRFYSSTHQNDASGTGHAQSKLCSVNGWCAGKEGSWMVMDASKPIPVLGVVVQARNGFNQFAIAIKLACSDNGIDWTDVADGAEMETGCVAGAKGVLENRVLLFPSLTTTRYVKIDIIKGHKALRACLY